MDKDDVIAFFNRRALSWDARRVRDELVIRKILDNAEIWDGLDILDVACGTGVLISDYLARGVRHITGIDIAPEMIRIAQEKFPQKQV